MAKTAAQMATEVAYELGFIGAGQTLPAADQTIITDALTSVVLELQRDHAIDWGPGDDIPDWAVVSMTTYLANRVAKKFHRRRDLVEVADLVASPLQGGPDAHIYIAARQHPDFVDFTRLFAGTNIGIR